MRSFSLPSASAAVLGSLLAVPASAILRSTGGMLVGPMEDTLVDGTSGYNGWGTFDQLIDHSNPGLGTFKQRYWYGTEFWKGPGSPVVMLTPGEQAADRFNVTYTTTARLPGLFAKEIGGAVIVLEHRYWGQSSPFDELTDENLQYLTLEDSIRDLTYFARNFDPPFDKSGASCPTEAPWVFSGGSYPGALAGWIEAIDPGTFWAYHGTSGVVEAIGDFWQYFAPVQEATPQNCSKDLSAVIDYIDDILLNGSPDKKLELKDKFLLGDLEDADFAAALENGPWLWQSTQFYSVKTTGYNPYYRFCDYIENVWPDSNSSIPGPGGVGVDKALSGYAKWFKEVELPGFCEGYGYDDFKGELNTACFASLNASNPMYTDLTVGNPVNRQWMWMLCNEPFEYWQDGAPQDRPSIVSRLVNVDYWRTQCGLYFKTYGIADGKSAEDVNEFTGGWSYTDTTRLMYANGQLDPWRDATVSSQFRPDGPLQSTPELPVYLIPEGIHCSDFYSQNWDANPTLKAIVDEEVATMKRWVAEFYTQKERRAVEWTG